MAAAIDHRGPSRSQVAAAVALGGLIGYAVAVDPIVRSPLQVLYPLVWLTASALALRSVLARSPSLSWRALAVGVGYAATLLWTAGLLGPATTPRGVSIHLGLPGWGPAVRYAGSFVSVTVVPFLTAGYATLGLLAAVAVQRTWRASVPGVVGLFACASCTAPLVVALAGSLGTGLATPLATTLRSAQYPVATASFLLSVGAFLFVLRRTDG